MCTIIRNLLESILYKARYFLTSACTKQLYFSFIHTYLNYGNITWGSTNKSKLNVILRRQKHASRIIYFKDKYTHARPLLKEMNALRIVFVLQTHLRFSKITHFVFTFFL